MACLRSCNGVDKKKLTLIWLESLARNQSIWPHSAVLIKSFSSEAALFTLLAFLPGLVESPNSPHRASAPPPRFLVGKRQDKNQNPFATSPLFLSLRAAPSDDLLSHRAKPRALASRTTTSAPAAVHRCLQSASGLASSPAPPV